MGVEMEMDHGAPAPAFGISSVPKPNLLPGVRSSSSRWDKRQIADSSSPGPRDTYSDVGVDAQFESKAGSGNVVVRGSWIHESQTLEATEPAGGAANLENTLKELRVNASYYPQQWLGVTAGWFDTRGTSDSGLYPAEPVDGSANGSPETNGFLGEIDLNPWENTRVGLQYTRVRELQRCQDELRRRRPGRVGQ
jgi:hypothetical protein